jgi:hypothetical protein
LRSQNRRFGMGGTSQMDLANYRVIVRRMNVSRLAIVQPFAIKEKPPAFRSHFRLSCHASPVPNPCALDYRRYAR